MEWAFGGWPSLISHYVVSHLGCQPLLKISNGRAMAGILIVFGNGCHPRWPITRQLSKNFHQMSFPSKLEFKFYHFCSVQLNLTSRRFNFILHKIMFHLTWKTIHKILGQKPCVSKWSTSTIHPTSGRAPVKIKVRTSEEHCFQHRNSWEVVAGSKKVQILK